jgi:ComF family protein
LSALFRMPVESLFATFFPGDCRICSDPLLNISRLPVCTNCIDNIQTFVSTQCAVCGELLVARNFRGDTQGTQLCGLCQQVRPRYIRAVSHGPYEGVLRDLVHLLKYEKVNSAAEVLGERLAQAIEALAEEVGPKPIAIPVPLHTTKLRQRGFNQTERIASQAARVLRTSFPIELVSGVLQRMRATTSQTGLTRHQRRLNVRGSFRVDRASRRVIAGRNVILIDDVFTTGTTAEECTRVLLRAGAKNVWIATVARVSKLEALATVQGSQSWQEEAASFAPGNAFDGES